MFWKKLSDENNNKNFLGNSKILFDAIKKKCRGHILRLWSTVAENFPENDPGDRLGTKLWGELLSYSVWLRRLPGASNVFEREQASQEGKITVGWLKEELILTREFHYRLAREHIVKVLVRMVETLPKERSKNLVVLDVGDKSLRLIVERLFVIQLLSTFIDIVGQEKLSPHDVKNLILLSQHLEELDPGHAIKEYQANLDESVDDVVNLLFNKKISFNPSLQ